MIHKLVVLIGVVLIGVVLIGVVLFTETFNKKSLAYNYVQYTIYHPQIPCLWIEVVQLIQLLRYYDNDSKVIGQV